MDSLRMKLTPVRYKLCLDQCVRFGIAKDDECYEIIYVGCKL